MKMPCAKDADSVLVTGASGFIGRHLVRRLIGRGDRVSCLVRATSQTSDLRTAGARLIVGDQPHVESDAPAPVSAYGRSKLEGESAAARHASAMAITIVRPPVVFGPGDRGVLEMFRPIVRWGVHVTPGPRPRRISLIHVADLVEGLLLAARQGERLDPRGSPGQGIYFFADPECPTYADLGQAMAKALGKDRAAIVCLPAPVMRLVGQCGDALGRVRQRPCWLNSDKVADALAGSWTCSAAKACTQLDWTPTATLSGRLRETAQWYRQTGWL